MQFLEDDSEATAMLVFPTKVTTLDSAPVTFSDILLQALAQDQKLALQQFIAEIPSLSHLKVSHLARGCGMQGLIENVRWKLMMETLLRMSVVVWSTFLSIIECWLIDTSAGVRETASVIFTNFVSHSSHGAFFC